MTFFVLVCFSIICSFQFVLSTQPEVTIKDGTLRGLYKRSTNNREYASFEGIPYARPPEGKNRFKEPVPVKPWLGIYNATKEPSRCIQVDMLAMVKGGPFEVVGSEDCLYINVYTPKLPSGAADEKLFDVIVFIHGGSFLSFSSTFHDARLLLNREVILVTFNYRLGALGFLSTEDGVVPGNNGFKDQTLALKWIQQNIAAFGGNPNSVTLSGLSAGGASCHLHLLSPLSKGLFKGAICMSGVSLNPWAVTKNPINNARLTAEELGCPTNDTKLMVKCLRRRPAEHIVSTLKLFWKEGDLYTVVVPFAAVVEPNGPGAFITDLPLNILQQKAAMDIPLILSFTKDEGLTTGAAIISNQDTFNRLLDHWDEIITHNLQLLIPEGKLQQPINYKALAQKIKDYYKIDNSEQGAKNLIKQIGDFIFVTGIAEAAELHSTLYTSPVYLSQFSYRGEYSTTRWSTEENLGVNHADDSLYVFGTSLFGDLKTDSDIQMAKNMVDVWVSFAANGSLGDNWQPVSQHLPQLAFMDIRGPNDLRSSIADDLGERKFWNSLFSSSHDEL